VADRDEDAVSEPMTDLDKALAGDLDAIEKNFVQMIGALNHIDTDVSQGFVGVATLQNLAGAILDPKAGRPLTTLTKKGKVKSIEFFKFYIGQGVTASIHPEPKDDARDQVALTGMDGTYLYMSLPTKAMRKWARRRRGT